MAHAESAGTEGAWAGLGASGAPGDSGAPGSAGPGDAGDSGAPGSAGPGDAADSGAPGSAGSDLGDVAGSRDAEGSPGRHRSPDDATAAPAVHALALLAIPAAVVGIASSLVLLAISYLAGQVERFLFLGGAVSNNIMLLPLLCVVVLPVWLIATGRPEMRVPRQAANPDVLVETR